MNQNNRRKILKDFIIQKVARKNNIVFTLTLKDWIKIKYPDDNSINRKAAFQEMRDIARNESNGLLINEVECVRDFKISVIHIEKLKRILNSNGYKLKKGN